MSETASSAAVRVVVEVGGATRKDSGAEFVGYGLRGSGGEGGGGRAADKKERRQPVKSDNPTHITM